MGNQAFIDQVAEYAVQDMVRTVLIGTPILASYTIAQACLESSYGKAAINGNYFGVKGSGNSYQTKEFVNGQWITITASFATYGSMEASVIGHSQFLLENGRYTRHGVIAAGTNRDWKAACRALQAAGYATDPGYADKLISIINMYDLTKYDKEADNMLNAISQLQESVESLTKTVGDQAKRITALETNNTTNLKEIPDWAKDAVDAAVKAKLLATPVTGSYDFYRMITVLYRKGLF